MLHQSWPPAFECRETEYHQLPRYGCVLSCSPLYLLAELPTQQPSQLKPRLSSFLKVLLPHSPSSLIFLKRHVDVVPLPMPLSMALETRALKEKERIDEDPALSTRPIPSPLPKPTPLASTASRPVSSATTSSTTIAAAVAATTAAADSPGSAVPPMPSRTKSKSSTSNGRTGSARSKDKNKELSNGNGQPPPSSSEPEQKTHSRRGSRRSEQQGWVEPVSTEQHLAMSHLQPGGAQQLQWQEPPPPPPNLHTNSQPWLAGPASGFIDERVHVPEGPFGATGRTIYSQR